MKKIYMYKRRRI